MKLLLTKSQCAVLSALACLLSLTVLFSCTKAEESDEQAQIKNKKQSVWTEEDLKPKEGEVTEDGQPVVMIFGATVNYAQKKQQPAEDADSVTQEEEVDYGALAEKQALAESGDDGVEVKSHLGSLVETLDRKYYPNLWSIGDRVSINGVSTASLPEANITSGGKQARFPMTQWVEKYNGNWYVGYPADAFSYSAGGGTVTLPVKQKYVAGSYDPDAFIMVGKSDEQGLDFYPQVAPLRIVVPGASGTYFSKIRIEAVNGEQLSGTFSTDYNNEDATFTPVSGNSYVEMDTPNLEFGLSSPVFFVLPAITYERGLRIRVTRSSDGKEMVFSNTKSMTVSVGSMTALTSPTFTPTTAQTTPSLVEVTPSSFYVQWASSNPTKDYAKRWQILVWTNSACTGAPTRTIEIYPKTDDLHCWTDGQTPLRFVVGRLNPGATYYVKVRDVGNDNSNSTPASITLSSAPSCVEMPVSNITTTGVVLRENFSEIGWSAAYYNKKTACGFYPTSSRGSDSVSKREFDYLDTDENTTFYELSDLYGFSYDRMNTAHERSRIAKWLYSGYVYWMPGYIKTGTKNNKGYFFTPAIPLAAGKTAKVSVTIKVSKFDQNTSDTWALAVVSGVVDKWSAGDESEGHNKRLANSFTLPSTSDASLYRTMTFTEDDALLWTERTFENLYMSNGDRLVIGLPDGAAYGSSKARINIGSVTINVTELTDDIIIRDATSLDAFRGAVASSAGTGGRVVADFSASDIASSWTPIAGYTGTLKGQDHTISGLTKPMFADLRGTVQNLTLNSTVSSTDRTLEHLAIFAETLSGGTLSYCTSTGSVTYTPSAAIANGTRYVAGLVGHAQSGSITHCTNSATVSVPNNSIASNDAIIEAGGLVARLGSGTTSSVSCSDLINNGSVSIGIDATGSHNLYSRLGGVIAYVVNQKTENLDLPRFTNNGPVEFSGKSGKYIAIGGVVGEIHTSSKSTGSTWVNTNAVSMTSAARATNNDIIIGGVVGVQGFALSNCTNTGTVTNAGTFTDTKANIYIGGIAGNNNGKSLTSCHNETTGTIANSGQVSNSGAGVNIAIGGVVGNSSNSITSCSNSGVVENSGTSTENIYLGGVAGNANNVSLSSSYNNSSRVKNTGEGDYLYVGGVVGHAVNASFTSTNNLSPCVVSNTHAADGLICVGGIAGFTEVADEGTISMTTCYNTGSVSNSGSCADHACVGGLIGRATGVNSLVSTKAAYNYNKGPVGDSSSSDCIDIGGICGFADNASDFTFCRNLAEGIVTVGEGSPRNVYVSGILAIADGEDSAVILTSAINNGAINVSGTTISNILAVGGVLGQACGPFPTISGTSSDHTTNNGNITFTGVSLAKALRLAGVWGWRDNTNEGTIEYCTNSGNITANSGGLVTSYNGINAVGGVFGSGGGAYIAVANNLTVQNCQNSGNIYLNFKGCVYMGGIVGGMKDAPKNCSNSGGVSLDRSAYTTTTNSDVGGIVGYTRGGSRTFVNLHNTGNINTKTTNYSYAGGIIGYTNGASTFKACSVAGTITCSSHNPGLFYTVNGAQNVSFSDGCTVKSGTKLVSGGTTTTISSIGDITQTNIVGGGGTSTSLDALGDITVN